MFVYSKAIESVFQSYNDYKVKCNNNMIRFSRLVISVSLVISVCNLLVCDVLDLRSHGGYWDSEVELAIRQPGKQGDDKKASNGCAQRS